MVDQYSEPKNFLLKGLVMQQIFFTYAEENSGGTPFRYFEIVGQKHSLVL